MRLRLAWDYVRLYPWDTLGVAATLILLAAFFLLYGYFYQPSLYPRAFGPEWTCSYAGEGDPVCVKNGPVSGGPQ